MIFWDSSAILPLCVNEVMTPAVKEPMLRDPEMVVWWGTRVECVSAIARRLRDGTLKEDDVLLVRSLIEELSFHWHEVLPTDAVRTRAERLIMVHPLRAADSLQLAAALTWVREEPKGATIVCLDNNLRSAAAREGFTVLP
jgi:uncharacterized protein